MTLENGVVRKRQVCVSDLNALTIEIKLYSLCQPFVGSVFSLRKSLKCQMLLNILRLRKGFGEMSFL